MLHRNNAVRCQVFPAACATKPHKGHAPFPVSTDRAVKIGLVLTDPVINAQKHACNRRPAPLFVIREQHRYEFRLIVGDNGVGEKSSEGPGFGERMLAATDQAGKAVRVGDAEAGELVMGR